MTHTYNGFWSNSLSQLAPFAAHPEASKGRRYEEPSAARRDDFARDRDRIVHSNAFRRLMYKTQVFVNHEGDHYRTRLTHSLEVAQIGRTVALALGLNETLTEAICLAHDLGHTPFGHAGQDALNACMREHGGFEHNLQSLRIVDELEEKYASFDGLNLTFETREGILKHCSKNNAKTLGALGERFLDRTQPSLEAQLADIVDAVAYNNHDVEDGVRSGILSMEALREEPLFARHYDEVVATYGHQLPTDRLLHETKRRMIAFVVRDLITTSERAINDAGVASLDAVRAAPRLIAFSPEVGEAHQSLKRFLYRNLYHHPAVVAMQDRAKHMLTTLFSHYERSASAIPSEFRPLEHVTPSDAPDYRRIADYIAGMTDRFARQQFEALIGDQ
ncbi:MAG: deoxyguanosinetriphosphate triphosphohydrolase [Pseudomonadota bacterium]